MMYAASIILPQIESPESTPTFNCPSPTITSLSFQQGSQWGPSDIGTMVFGCVASVLGILALWLTYWLWQRQPGDGVRSGGLSHFCLSNISDGHALDGSVCSPQIHGNVTVSDDDISGLV